MKAIIALMFSLTILAADYHRQAVADVQYRSETTVKFGGALGGIVKFFGGSKPQKGMTYLKGNTLRTDTDEKSQIIDLDKELFITIDHDEKEYTTLTFEEMRRQMEEATRKAEKEAREREPKDKPAASEDVKAKFNISIKETGRKQTIDGAEAREVLLTMSIEGEDTSGAKGGLITTSTMWVAKTVPGYQEVRDFYRRLAEKLGREWLVGIGKMLEAAFQSDPRMRQSMDEFRDQSEKIDGTPLLTELTMDIVGSRQPEENQTTADQKEDKKEDKKEGGIEKPSLGGLFGKLKKKKADEKESSDEGKTAQGGVHRSTLLTSTTKITGFSTKPLADDLFQIPAGYKQK